MGRKEHLLQWTLVVTAALVMAVFWNVLHLGLLRFGDGPGFIENIDVRHFNLWRLFSYGSYRPYAPLTAVTFALEALYFGLDPFHFHLINLLIHLVNTLLVLLLFYRLSRGSFAIAAFGGILFSIHPMQVETVAWASGRSELLCTFFLLSASHLYLKYAGKTAKKASPFTFTHVASLVLFVLALFSNPAAVVFPLALFLFDLQQGRKIRWETLLEKIPFAAIAAVYSVLVILLMGQPVLQKVSPSAIFSQWSALWNPAWIYPFQKAFPAAAQPLWPAWLALYLLILVALFSKRCRGQIIFGLGFFLVMVWPDFHSASPDGDRLLGEAAYIGGLGIFYAASWLLSMEMVTEQNLRKLLRPVGLVALCGLTWILSDAAHWNVGVWSNDKSVFENVLSRDPKSPIGLYAMGVGTCSLPLLDRSLALQPHSWLLYEALGACYSKTGQMTEALNAFERSVSENPEEPRVWLDRGLAKGRSGNLAGAIQDLRKSAEMDDQRSETFFQLAGLLERSGALSDAETALKTGLDLDPRSAEAHHDLGNVYMEQNQLDKAVYEFATALQIDDNLPQTHFSLGNVYAAMGMGDRAFEEYQRSIRLAPDLDGAHANLALLLLRTGKVHEAEDEYKKALELNPKLTSAHRGLAEAYEKDGRAEDSESEKKLAVENPDQPKIN